MSYKAPKWQNGGPPALNAQNLQEMSDAIELSMELPEASVAAGYIPVSTGGGKVAWQQRRTTITATLTAGGWLNETAPYSLGMFIPEVTATSKQTLCPALDITAEQLEQLQAANIQDGGQEARAITLKAFGEKPTIDIPIRIIVEGG